MNYDKPRLMSTIILGILLIPSLAFSIILAPVTVHALTAEGGWAIIGAVFGLVLIIMLEIALTVVNALGLLFSVLNRKSTLKPVRIVSYVMDGLFGAMTLLAIIKIILLAVGV